MNLHEQRIQDIKSKLLSIVNDFEPTEDNPELTMFELISEYNKRFDNLELIGGKWVRKNIPELADLT